MAMEKVHFEVEGDGPFPLQMLHVDQCYPARPIDVLRMLTFGFRRVRLCIHALPGQWDIARGSWERHGWEVKDDLQRGEPDDPDLGEHAHSGEPGP
jgi:hypothetical protein